MVKISYKKIGVGRSAWLVLCLFITFSGVNTLNAQVINGNNWYFGNSQNAILFKKSNNDFALDDMQATPYGRGGSVVISSEVDGNTIFYSDGVNIYDATHQTILNGTGLSGDSSINQATVAAPRPGSANNREWLIFTNSGSAGVNEIQYTRVNSTFSGNAMPGQPVLGEVIPTEKNVSTGLVNPAPGMLMVRSSSDPTNFWLISENNVTREFQVTLIDAGLTLVTQTFPNPGPLITAESFSAVQISSDTVRIAVSPQEANANIQLWTLDISIGNPESGMMTFERTLTNTGNSDDVSPAIYDTEWSADGSKLYISRQGSTGNTANLFQVDFNDSLENVNSILSTPVFRSFGLKLGPNDTLYHLYQPTAAAPIELGAVNQPRQTFDSTAYDLQPSPGTFFNGLQFPSQAIPNMSTLGAVVFAFEDACFGSSTKFTPKVDIPPAFYFWDFGDGSTSFSHSPVHTYGAAGTFTVMLSVFLNGATDTFSQTVNIIDPMLMVDIFPDSTICPGQIVVLDPMPDPATSAVSYTWSTGETTPTIDVDSTGTYWVSVQSSAIDPNTGLPSGCMAFDEVMILVYGDTVQASNQWYFGDKAGIDFNETPPLALTDGESQSPEAAATISDIDGELLFYTNGTTVYNKEHTRMFNGDNIGGDSTSAQGALIVQLPDDETIFYIFMTDPAWGDQTFDLNYAMVDMKLDTARGGVILKDRPVYFRSTERLTASSPGGNLVWLLSHEFGNNTFRAYPIDTTGIRAPRLSSVGTRLSSATEGHSRNSMKLSADVSKVAMTIAGAENFVEVFDFVDSVGEVTNPLKINIGEPAPAEIYGVEWSSDNQKLYVTTRGGGNSKLLQFDVDTTDVATIEASKFEVANDAQEFGQIQTGPNGVIYMAVDGAGALGTINSPNADDAGVGFVLAGFDLAGQTSTLGLPNFVQNQSQPPPGPSLTVGPGCRGQVINMSANGTSNIDTYEWIFGDGQGTGPMAPMDTSHVYNLPGDYTVQVRITNVCGLDTLLSQAITINVDIPRPTVPGVSALCDDTLILDAYEGSPQLALPTFIYNWSTGDTTQTVSITVPSTLTVSVTDRATGCVSDTVTVLVGDGRPQVDLGPPMTLCQDVAFGPLDAGNPGASYAWTINGTNSGSGRFQNVNSSVAGVFDYEVAVTDPITGCIGRSTLNITVNEEPQISLTTVATLACGASDGSINLTFTSSGNFDYDVISGGAGSTSVMAGSFSGPGSINIPGLAAGNYSVTATNQVTGCSNTISANINDGNTQFLATLTPVPGCSTTGNVSDLGDLTLNLTDNGGGLPSTFDYELIDNAGVTVQSGSSTAAALPLSLTDLDSGVYNIVVTRTAPGLPCVQTAQVTLDELPPANIIVDPIYNFCGGQGTIPATVTPGASLTWTLPDGSTAVVNSLVTTQSGTHTVRSTGAGLCDRVETVEVIISNDPVVTIDVSGDLCDGMLTLTASSDDPVAANSFIWGSTDSNNGAIGSSIVVMQSGTFTVTPRNQSTGCLANTSIDVLVEPVLELFITSDPDCDNNPNVFLIAESNITADVVFEWIDPAGNILPDTTATISVTESGTYTARVIRRVSGCDASALFNIIVEPIDDADLILPIRAVICPLDASTASTTLDAGVFNTYEWRLLPDETVISRSQILTVNTEGRYEVTLFNGFTCTRDVIDVVEDCTPRIFAPNAFTPNGDGINDNFFVFSNPFVTDFEIWIHNRWGELVFQADNIDFRWDGEFRGEMGTVGTYAYVVRFRSTVEELGELEQHGAVTLIR